MDVQKESFLLNERLQGGNMLILGRKNVKRRIVKIPKILIFFVIGYV